MLLFTCIRDDFVNSPISALRFISLPLRRTASTPRDTRFARLDLGLFSKSSMRMTFYEFIIRGPVSKNRIPPVLVDTDLILTLVDFARSAILLDPVLLLPKMILTYPPTPTAAPPTAPKPALPAWLLHPVPPVAMQSRTPFWAGTGEPTKSNTMTTKTDSKRFMSGSPLIAVNATMTPNGGMS